MAQNPLRRKSFSVSLGIEISRRRNSPNRRGWSDGRARSSSFGLDLTVIGSGKNVTTAEDTRQAARRIGDSRAGLLVFCGGDGTARNVLEAADMRIPALGVPTGVKMHSAVFAVNPKAAARIAFEFLNGDHPLREAEVMDVDEEAFRAGRVSAELCGYLLAPYEPHLIQEAKLASPMTESELRNQAAIALHVIETMQPDTLYVVGPGTTTRTIGDLLDQKKTLLGVDIFCNRKIIAHDVNQDQILEETRGKRARIIVTPIGGQGFVFGRGNQQIGPEVIRRVGLDEVIVVATEGKLQGLTGLRVDTGDQELDDAIRKHGLRVVADYKTEYRIRVG